MACDFRSPSPAFLFAFALDEDTAHRLKRLSSDWKVSQAEVVRRAVQQADSAIRAQEDTPLQALKSLHDNGTGLVREEAEAYLEDLRRDRREWRGP